MAVSVSEGRTPNVFHAILGAIWTGVMKDSEQSWKGYLEEGSTDKRFYDDVEWVDPGLWDETDEGNEINLDEYGEGYVTRWRPLKFAKRLIIPEEIKEDAVYEEAYDAVRMLGRTCVQTQDYYAVGVLDSAADTNVVGGDGVCLINSAHPIKGGATVSNLLNPALTPSNTSVQLMHIAAERMIGSNGYITGIKVKGFFGPTAYKFRFKEILKSDLKDDTANHAINAVKGEGADIYKSVPQMASSTNWFARTDAPRGARFVWRRKPRFKKSDEIRNESEIHVGSARFLASWSNWRTYFGSMA